MSRDWTDILPTHCDDCRVPIGPVFAGSVEDDQAMCLICGESDSYARFSRETGRCVRDAIPLPLNEAEVAERLEAIAATIASLAAQSGGHERNLAQLAQMVETTADGLRAEYDANRTNDEGDAR